ncbi:hypothetical protein M426DRAFT_24426 [Hypoxylon sp. CI-4A]|nr:hypothetical protein M426DRAFT_24426 [Hypoxylon sp. CI-4A]
MRKHRPATVIEPSSADEVPEVHPPPRGLTRSSKRRSPSFILGEAEIPETSDLTRPRLRKRARMDHTHRFAEPTPMDDGAMHLDDDEMNLGDDEMHLDGNDDVYPNDDDIPDIPLNDIFKAGAGGTQRSYASKGVQTESDTTQPLTALAETPKEPVTWSRISEEEVSELIQRKPQRLIRNWSKPPGVRALYWGEEIEALFLKEPAKRLGMAVRRCVWKTMLICFNATPPHLFTYGLKPHDESYKGEVALRLTDEFSEKLERVCAHPLWEGNLAKLRYVLQEVVAFSVDDHIAPIYPLSERPQLGESIWAVLDELEVYEEENPKEDEHIVI